MPKKIEVPEERKFRLEKFDPEGDSYVVIRKAVQRQHAALVNTTAPTTTVYTDEFGIRRERITTVGKEEIKRRAVYLTLVDSNLADRDGAPLFRFTENTAGQQYLDMEELEFDSVAWGTLPPECADEIYEYVLAVNPLWKKLTL